MKAYNVCHWSLYLDSLINTWTASSCLQINPKVLPKDKILFLISKFNFVAEKKQQVEIHKGHFYRFASRSGAGPPGAGSKLSN